MSSSSAKKVGEWSWEENKAFEVALDKVAEETPNRWEVIAASYVPGKKPEEIAEHYEKLVYDVKLIESGYYDHVSSSTAQNNTSAAKDASTTTTISSKEAGGNGVGGGGSGGKKKKKKKKNEKKN
ncbi:protein RADIALIS-like 4 [Dioscorea cayenensis subsp. rotundata]|uniref:Protein RADIALIS-like 4 n=1 Tax=Dioscorea cayennensis subsp. rotundata TaxID=55577 RepID=A0AB40CPS3_DIOCR|nr:protein RADIALIS-like 4 [Dioscorea cayenensis subsp. rotundata]